MITILFATSIVTYHFESEKKLTTCSSFKEKSTKMGYIIEILRLCFNVLGFPAVN